MKQWKQQPSAARNGDSMWPDVSPKSNHLETVELLCFRGQTPFLTLSQPRQRTAQKVNVNSNWRTYPGDVVTCWLMNKKTCINFDFSARLQQHSVKVHVILTHTTVITYCNFHTHCWWNMHLWTNSVTAWHCIKVVLICKVLKSYGLLENLNLFCAFSFRALTLWLSEGRVSSLVSGKPEVKTAVVLWGKHHNNTRLLMILWVDMTGHSSRKTYKFGSPVLLSLFSKILSKG